MARRPWKEIEMRSTIESKLAGCLTVIVLLAPMVPTIASAQAVGDSSSTEVFIAEDGSASAETFTADEAPVVELDYSGPRFGMTWDPAGGAPMSQFGWHFEHQTASAKRGPRFVVETILLAGGIEEDRVIPNATLVFGVRLPAGGEFGVGPSFTLGPAGASSAIVVACGHSFKAGGIRVPINFAVSLDSEGQRMSLVTGWAVRAR